ncbi:MAG: hypothetical protein IPG93_10925 [Burkholderiales bacterium]|nr:hypothetical protein [Burkholderiales bacterium]
MQSTPHTKTPTAAEAVEVFNKSIDRLGIRAEQLKALTDALIVCTTHLADEGTCESMRYLASELATDVHALVRTVEKASANLCELATRSEPTPPDNITRLPGTLGLVHAGADVRDTPASADALHAVPPAAEPTN